MYRSPILLKQSPSGRLQMCSLGRYSSGEALGPPQSSCVQRGEAVANGTHHSPSQETTRPSTTPVYSPAGRRRRSRAPAPRRGTAPRLRGAASVRSRVSASRRDQGGRRGGTRTPESPPCCPSGSESVPQNAASAAATTTGDAIPLARYLVSRPQLTHSPPSAVTSLSRGFAWISLHTPPTPALLPYRPDSTLGTRGSRCGHMRQGDVGRGRRWWIRRRKRWLNTGEGAQRGGMTG